MAEITKKYSRKLLAATYAQDANNELELLKIVAPFATKEEIVESARRANIARYNEFLLKHTTQRGKQ